MAPRITCLTVPTPFRIGPINCWLIEGDALTIVDVGPNDPASLAALERLLAENGYRLEDLDLILLTHQHYDHLGLTHTVRERSGAQVVTHEDLAPFLRGGATSSEAEDQFAEQVMALHGVDSASITELRAASQARWKFGCACTVDRTLADGDNLDLGGIVLRTHHRPGHSPTDTIFVDETTGRAFVGDHLLGSISANPILHRPVHGPADAVNRPRTLARYLESMDRSAALGLTEALTGHRDTVSDVAGLVERRHRETEERKEQIFAATEAGPCSAFAIVRVLWPRLPVDQVYLGICEVLGHVDLLVTEGRLEEVTEQGSVRIARC